MKADRLTYVQNYSDGSGVEFGVTYINEMDDISGDNGYVEIEHIGKITIPITKVPWLIQCLSGVLANETQK